ncbi:MAG TPA: hypothetical protein P5121_20755 [Caldilineaceae bacterium]|nr:hypothetical protein [Caldilineaceae bacterium]
MNDNNTNTKVNNGYANHATTGQTTADQVKDAREQAQEAAQEAAQGVKAKASEVAQQVETQAEQWREQAKAKANDVSAELRDTAESTFDEQKNRTADQAEGIAHALRQSSQELRSNDQEAIAYYTDMAADQVEHFSGYVRSKGLTDVMHDVQDLARRQPELFVAGMLAGGFLLGRFLKSSQRAQSRSHQRNYGSDNRPYAYSTANRSYAGSPGDQAYAEYYAENRRSPYPENGYPRYASEHETSAYGQSRTQSGSYQDPTFTGGATAFNGERSTHGPNRTNYGSDPAVTGADWGADYQANEYGQTKPVTANERNQQAHTEHKDNDEHQKEENRGEAT